MIRATLHLACILGFFGGIIFAVMYTEHLFYISFHSTFQVSSSKLFNLLITIFISLIIAIISYQIIQYLDKR